MLKYILIFSAMLSMAYADVNLYMGFNNGGYYIEGIGSRSLAESVYGIGLEYEKNLYDYVNLVGGVLYESEYKLRNDSGSYDFAALYLGVKYYANKEAKINPYIVGRYGYPYFLNEDKADFTINRASGWGEIGLGVRYKERFLGEILYEQHGADEKVYNQSYSAKLLSLKFAYKLH